MRRMPRISVVVPIYDVESYLATCLQSLARQTMRDLEVIMVDDGSTDGSRALAERFACQDRRFHLVGLKLPTVLRAQADEVLELVSRLADGDREPGVAKSARRTARGVRRPLRGGGGDRAVVDRRRQDAPGGGVRQDPGARAADRPPGAAPLPAQRAAALAVAHRAGARAQRLGLADPAERADLLDLADRRSLLAPLPDPVLELGERG